MRIFAIGDPHLSLAQPKPMDVFGPKWERHAQRMAENWRAVVAPDDVVLVPGDISWAMQLGAAKLDLEMIGALPGRKILLRGNHDYWWSSLAKVRSILPSGMVALQNNCVQLPGLAVVGTRGWTIPSEGAAEEDRKIYAREVERLSLSLKDMERQQPTGVILGMTHFPPFLDLGNPTDFTRLFAQYGVKTVCYGHLHNLPPGRAFEGEIDGVTYVHVSSDYIDFTPKYLMEI